jgi:Helix-turn-helix domain
VLLSYAWQQGSCCPGYGRLQQDLQRSVDSVTKWIQELEGAGPVARGERGRGKTTLYTLHDPPAPPPGPGAGPAGESR